MFAGSSCKARRATSCWIPLGGSGTTLIACEKSGRRARLIELDPKYVDVIVKRWQLFSGNEANRASDGIGFNALVDASVSKTEPAPML